MDRMRRILIATDFSPDASHAARRAILLATAHGAPLDIVHVRKPVRPLGLGRPGDALLDDEALRAGPGAQLDALVADASAAGVHARGHLLTGATADSVQEAAADLGADLVVVGARGKRAIRDAIFGTTAERMVERAGRPVLIVKTPPRAPYANVLACVAVDPPSTAALTAAAHLFPGASLQLLHVYETLFEMKLQGAGVDRETIERYRRMARSEATQALAQLMDATGVPRDRLTTLLRHGYAPAVILRALGELSCDLVVLQRNRSRLAALFIGSVTKHVLRHARCDVLVLPA